MQYALANVRNNVQGLGCVTKHCSDTDPKSLFERRYCRWSCLLHLCRCCSIDGDADRLVYFQLSAAAGTSGTSAPRPVALLDGDKIAALAACLIKDLLAQLPEQERQGIKVNVRQDLWTD
jgi:hypothetical protein